ncbi:Metallopeptidase M20, variant 2 [Perkinsus olseni]|uniref:Metallopeptidase M20, variant 2 n=4 Tax=Perkinsus olseni TaxID=32597 RepID=A0A7J6PAF3_PEROL|nr:Metallopeptidase M20, variant 2 [Perkinsus olseni]
MVCLPCCSRSSYHPEGEDSSTSARAMKVSIGDIITSVAFLEGPSSGRQLLLADVDGCLSALGSRPWPSAWSEDWHCRAHQGGINEVAPLEYGHFLTCSVDKTAAVWSTTTGGREPVEVGRLTGGHDRSVASVAGCLRRRMAVTGGRDCRVCWWDIDTLQRISSTWTSRNVVTRLRILPESLSVVQLSEDLQFRVWDMRTAALVHSAPCGPDQLVSCAVGRDATCSIICGSKGFTASQCRVKVFEPRCSWKEVYRSTLTSSAGGLQVLTSVDCCDGMVAVGGAGVSKARVMAVQAGGRALEPMGECMMLVSANCIEVVMSEEFTLNIEESNAPHAPPKVDYGAVPASATGGFSSNLASSPYHPVTPQNLLPSPSIPYKPMTVQMQQDLSSAECDAVASVQTMADECELGFRETNQSITADPAKDLYKAMYEWIDLNQNVFVSRLAEAVAIPSVSGDPTLRPRVLQTVAWATKWCESLGGVTEPVDLGLQTLPDGSRIVRPPALFATFESTLPDAPTLCVYGHLDVQPASKEDGWDTEPFQLTEKDGNLYGRGATDDKGPVLCWLWFVEFHRKFNLPLPCNLKCVFEGMEESGSEGLEECLKSVSETFFHDVDGICISDNYWMGLERPCVTWGIRGNVYFAVEVRGGTKDLHSGAHGGAVQEPMTDLIKIMSTLVDSATGKILVPGIYDEVDELTEEEKERYERCDFDVASYANEDTGGMPLLSQDKATILMARSRYPTLSLHGIERAFAGAGAKTVIPRTVVGKFSIRTVPHMTIDHVAECVKRHVVKVFDTLGSKNRLKVNVIHAGKPWMGDLNGYNYRAAAAATKQVWGVEPDYTREGGSIPITLTFEEVSGGKPAILLPIGQGNDGAHSQNEKISRRNYIMGAKTLGTYVYEFSRMTQEEKAKH